MRGLKMANKNVVLNEHAQKKVLNWKLTSDNGINNGQCDDVSISCASDGCLGTAIECQETKEQNESTQGSLL